MGGVINEDGDIRPDGAPVGRDTTFDSLTLPPTFRESSSDNGASRAGSFRFSDDIATVARILFPGQLEAHHAVKMAGVFALARQGVGHWIDGVCGDGDFLKEYGGALADLKGVSLARLKSFVRTHAAEVEKLSEFVRSPESAGTANLELAHFVIAASLLHTERTIVRGGATENLTAEVTLALDLARRVDPALLAEWKGIVRHMLRHGIDELVGQSKQELTPEIRAWQYAHPCTFFLPMFCVADTPKTYIADVLEGSRLLANTGVLAAFVEEASHLGSEEAANFFGRTVAKVGEIVTKISKDRSSATATLGALVEQLPVTDRLALIEVLAADLRATELGRRFESYGILKKDAGYASWLILHRERVVELDGKSGSFADHLVELAENRPGIRPGLVALVRWSDRFVEADLIGGALTLIKSSLDPSKVKQRIDAAGESLQSGSSAEEAQAILERGTSVKPIASLPLSKTPPIVVTPIRTILYERLAATPELQEWVLDTFNRSDEPTEISRCLRRVAAKSPAVTPRLVAFLKEFGTEPGCRQFLASLSGFERLADFLSHGRHEEIREFKGWLRGETVEDPMALRTLHGFGKSPSPAVVAADAEDRDKSNPHRDHIFIPLGAYRRLVVIGGEYSPPKRTAIEEAAGEMSVVFFSPDDNSRSIRQTLIRGDLVVINSEKISHSTSERVVAQCRAQDIAWIRVAHSGYKVVADIAARIRG